MEQKPADVHELLMRALQAQIDLGYGEVVVSRRTSPPDVGSRAPEVTEGVVSVTEALEAQSLGESVPTPMLSGNAMDFFEKPQFDTVEAHYEAICNCELCPLAQNRNKLVYGVGNPHADMMFVGEGPGREEDLRGEPFVGRAGQLLDKILAAMQLSRREVYIANIVKCRPPNNRDPQPEEMNSCFPHLREQIRIIRPRMICALGRIAGQALLKTAAPLSRLRGTWHEYDGVPVLVTYHPAALLRFPQYKKETWADMQILLARYHQSR